MCGISGELYFDGRPADKSQAASMIAAIRHRGPDDTGIFAEDSVSLGVARLSVIDIETGHQPIHNEDQTVHVVMNGEIYNYQELRDELVRQGHHFYTGSDTEVIVHLYEEHGERLAGVLRGMFAIALWDRRRRRLLLVRDRLGVKPLYYYLGPDRLVFGSELKALLAAAIPRDIDPQAVDDYLTHGYVPGPTSIFQNVSKLPAAQWLSCEQDGRIQQKRYWDVLDHQWDDEHQAARDPGSRGAAFWELLKESVRYRLVSDVPLGVLLSGGIDSTAIVAALREVTSQSIKTFTVGFQESSYDESAIARMTANHFGTQHHEFVAQPDCPEIVSEYLKYLDEPYGESSAIPIYYVAKMASQEITVAVGGDGGDELMGGYNHYFASRLMARYRQWPGLFSRRLVPWAVKALPVSHSRASFENRAKRFVSAVDDSPERAQLRWLEVISDESKERLYGPALADYPNRQPASRFTAALFERGRSLTPLTRLMYLDQQLYLCDGILTKVDRMTMAHSLESRGPFLDHKLVEFSLRLPDSCKIRGWNRKYLLKKLLKGKVPRAVLSQKKMGFVIPLAQWLNGPLKELLCDSLSEDSLRRSGFFDPKAVQQLVQEHLAKRRDHSKALWGILVFTLWLDRYTRAPEAAN